MTNIQYYTHLLLHSKYKFLINILVLLLIYIIHFYYQNYTFCMFNPVKYTSSVWNMLYNNTYTLDSAEKEKIYKELVERFHEQFQTKVSQEEVIQKALAGIKTTTTDEINKIKTETVEAITTLKEQTKEEINVIEGEMLGHVFNGVKNSINKDTTISNMKREIIKEIEPRLEQTFNSKLLQLIRIKLDEFSQRTEETTLAVIDSTRENAVAQINQNITRLTQQYREETLSATLDEFRFTVQEQTLANDVLYRERLKEALTQLRESLPNNREAALGVVNIADEVGGIDEFEKRILAFEKKQESIDFIIQRSTQPNNNAELENTIEHYAKPERKNIKATNTPIISGFTQSDLLIHKYAEAAAKKQEIVQQFTNERINNIINKLSGLEQEKVQIGQERDLYKKQIDSLIDRVDNLEMKLLVANQRIDSLEQQR